VLAWRGSCGLDLPILAGRIALRTPAAQIQRQQRQRL